MGKKICFIITTQFGYHKDTYSYCNHIDKTSFDVHYIGFDSNFGKVNLDGVTVHYIPVLRNRIKRYLNYIYLAKRIIRKEKFDLLFIVDCQGSFLIRILNLLKISILDVRTGDVKHTDGHFSRFNFMIQFSSLFYNRITIISESLCEKLQLPPNKTHILPLGGDEYFGKDKRFNNMNLLYVGSLDGRNIHQTIEGLSIFLKNTNATDVKYDIVGFGLPETINIIKATILNYSLDGKVFFHGPLFHDQLFPLYEKCNVGLVYVPVHDGYTCQPATKLFECALAGMALIATSTIENRRYVNDDLGVVVDDNPEAFARGLSLLYDRRESYSSSRIKGSFKDYTWENIVKGNLEPYLNSILCTF